MHYQTSRTLARRGHIAIAVFQFVYIYTPLHAWPHGITIVQWVTFPLLVLSGVWLHSGGKIWRRLQRDGQRPALPSRAPVPPDAPRKVA